MKRLFAVLILVLILPGMARAENLTVAAGAGYKKLVTDLAAAFETAGGRKVDLIFGNMGQVTTQAKTSGAIQIVVGERSFLDKADLSLIAFTEIGQGVLVVAWPRSKSLSNLADLARPDIRRVAMPDPAKAVYGIAGNECLNRAGLADQVKDKLLVVATVPQVTAYVLTGEVDAGLTNLTDVLDLGERIGGYLKVDPALYSPISIGAGVLPGGQNREAVAAFTAFLASPRGQELARKHGL